jgi:hypothetical protein
MYLLSIDLALTFEDILYRMLLRTRLSGVPYYQDRVIFSNADYISPQDGTGTKLLMRRSVAIKALSRS